jgi:hypothetical protein
VGEGKDIRKGCRRVNVHMYENGKMRCAKIIPRMGDLKENDGGGEFNYYI